MYVPGTNDAKDTGSGGPDNWLHNCGGPDHTTLQGCTFADDYLSMISLVKTLGTTSAGPKIFTAIPPPLMAARSIGANQTVINSVYPKLIPLINAAGNVRGLSVCSRAQLCPAHSVMARGPDRYARD